MPNKQACAAHAHEAGKICHILRLIAAVFRVLGFFGPVRHRVLMRTAIPGASVDALPVELLLMITICVYHEFFELDYV